MIANLESRSAWGTTLLRVAVGVVFIAHGAQKLFVMTPAGLGGFFTQLGIPLPLATAWFIIAVELVGGIAMVAGLGTRVVAALFAAIMAVAFATVHGPQGFFLPNGYEFVMVLFAASSTLVVQGAGAFALDNMLWERKGGFGELSTARA
jgi:putative oxidoreductase